MLPVWMWTQLASVYDAAFLTPYPFPGRNAVWSDIFVALGALGLARLILDRSSATLIVVTPIVAAVAGAAAGLYPLGDRISLFLAPSLAVLSTVGAVAVGQWVRRLFEPAALLAVALPVMPVVLALSSARPPIRLQETRPLFEEVSAQWGSGDVLYSYFAANQAAAYYGERLGLTEWRPGACTKRGDAEGLRRQLEALAGYSRVWVVFTHVLPRRRDDPETILAYLRERGSEERAIVEHRGAFGTVAYLFDLSDAAASERASIETQVSDGNAAGPDGVECWSGPVGNWRLSQRE